MRPEDPIGRVYLGGRASNALRRLGVATCRDLLEFGPGRLLGVPGVGAVTYQRVLHAQQRVSARLRQQLAGERQPDVSAQPPRAQPSEHVPPLSAPPDDRLGKALAYARQEAGSRCVPGGPGRGSSGPPDATSPPWPQSSALATEEEDKEFEAEGCRASEAEVRLSDSIASISLSTKEDGALRRLGVTTVGEFLSVDLQRALQLPGYGHTTYRRLDVVILDEIQTIRFPDEGEIVGALKGYLEQGEFRVMQFRGTSDASFVMLANIPTTSRATPKDQDLLKNLPQWIRGRAATALLDRFHGIIPGWELRKISKECLCDGVALKADYFGEIFHALRSQEQHRHWVADHVRSSGNIRDIHSVERVAAALLKLLFPDLSSVTPELFREQCLEPAKRLRERVRQQMSVVDDEYSPELAQIEVHN